MAAKHTHTYVGDPGYIHLLSTGPIQPAPGDKVELTDEVAATVGEDFEPTAEWAKAHAPKDADKPADTDPATAPAEPKES